MFHTKRTLSQAAIDHRLQTVTKVARKEQAALLAAPRNPWLWRMTTPPPPPKPCLPLLSRSVGEDWSYLNRRGQRARKEQVERGLTWMWTLQAAKREAVRAVLQLSAPIS
ncbi:hypothetical protein F4604DRAFT_1919666 [Suillus subluteus]|nr:hypothetical protein F4604DRAFT_1919666 [Suillus subluteus]